MEASPCSLPAEKVWTEENERTLINFFAKHRCLWDHKSEGHKSCLLRFRTLKELWTLLSSQSPAVSFTVDDINNKFKDLRTTFQRQYKMVKESKTFVPQWKYYQQLMFLLGSPGDKNPGDLPPTSPLYDPKENNSVDSSPELIASFLPTPSAPSYSGPTVKSYWTDERERSLISFYFDHSCLWNKKSGNYNNRQLRQNLLEALCDQLSDQTVSFSVEDVKGKFKNLRTTFNRECRMVQASSTSKNHYKSKWKHYQRMLFLCDESCDDEDYPDELHSLMEQGFTNQTPKLFNNCSQTSSDAGFTDIFKPDLPFSPSTSPSNGSPSFLNAHSLFQPEGKTMSDSRCLWSEAKVQQLISFYSEHSCLWSHKFENEENHLLRLSLLQSLSKMLSYNEPVPFTVEDIESKFRNLRTIFQREHKAVICNRSCGSEDFYLPKWKHYYELMFLCESCEEEEPPNSPHFPNKTESECTVHLPSRTIINSAATVPNLEDQASPTSPGCRHTPSSSPLSTFSPRSQASGRKRVNEHVAGNTSKLISLMKAVCQNQTESPHAGFLKYVEECLNDTPADKVKKLKKKIIDTIHCAAEEV